jgi:hypothetical protein
MGGTTSCPKPSTTRSASNPPAAHACGKASTDPRASSPSSGEPSSLHNSPSPGQSPRHRPTTPARTPRAPSDWRPTAASNHPAATPHGTHKLDVMPGRNTSVTRVPHPIIKMLPTPSNAAWAEPPHAPTLHRAEQAHDKLHARTRRLPLSGNTSVKLCQRRGRLTNAWFTFAPRPSRACAHPAWP